MVRRYGADSAVCAMRWPDSSKPDKLMTLTTPMVSSTEACMWACSMDELLWPVDQYKTLRDSDADGQVVNGPWLFESGLIDVLSEPAGLV